MTLHLVIVYYTFS